jgi:DNA-binding LytR/AlgR family response regulator
MPHVDLVGAAADGVEALKLLRDRRPDVVLIDADLPKRSGFEVIQTLGRDGCHVIMSSENPSHAAKAFDINAVDFLLKPITFDRLSEAVRRAQFRLFAASAEARFADLRHSLSELVALRANQVTAPVYERHVWTKSGGGLERVPVELFELLEAAGDYVVAYTADSSHLLSDSITALETRLDPRHVMRIHRSAIVGLEHVRAVRRRGRHDISLLLRSGKVVAVGRTYAGAVMKAVGARRWREQPPLR